MSFDMYKCQRYQKYVDSEGFNRLVFFFFFFFTKGAQIF